jgi:hypothetical protein
MALRPRLLLKSIGFARAARPFSTFPARKLEGKKSDGNEHVVDRKDELDVQSQASQSGMRKRQEDDQSHSNATSERDNGAQNEKAHSQNPKAPKPLIGMNDERGRVSFET